MKYWGIDIGKDITACVALQWAFCQVCPAGIDCGKWEGLVEMVHPLSHSMGEGVQGVRVYSFTVILVVATKGFFKP
ncbi:hypothetical protein HRbin16_01444 [bacterium HR16]|nr:hypothetical protein HRbin16_01444 [bacterium HR16]